MGVINMGQATTPDGIRFPGDVDRLTPVTFGPLQDIFEDMANSVQTAMDSIGQGVTPVTWTPVFANIDLGDEGVVSGTAYRIGDLVYVSATVVLGSDSAIEDDVAVSLPLDAPNGAIISVSGQYFDASTSTIYEVGAVSSGTDATLVVKDVDSHNYVSLVPVDETIPVVFDDGDAISFAAVYIETEVTPT
jgi:hypothetical protein